MDVRNDRPTFGALFDRRNRRGSCLAEALRFQLDACREAEGLSAIVVSDELGFCVAHSGGGGVHDEIAAQLPILVGVERPVISRAEGDESAPLEPQPLVVTTFFAAGNRLHAGAVEAQPGADSAPASVRAVLARVASGFSRMLDQ